MVSKATDAATKLRKVHGELVNDAVRMLPLKINQLKKQIQAERTESIKEKLAKNGERLQDYASEVLSAMSTREASYVKESGTDQKLANRIEHPVYKHASFDQGYVDKDHMNSQEMFLASTKLPFVEKLPPYVTWIFLERNQRMAEDQSVVGRRRIYYDQRGSEALVCSDSEDDITEPEEEKREFSEGEDRILWMAFQEHGVGEEVVDLLCQVIGGTSSEIQERYNVLKDKYLEISNPQSSEGSIPNIGISLEKSLSTALDSFDNLFCRRCMMFDCRLHGCSQPLVYPCEKQQVWFEHAEERKPCGDNCYLRSSIIQEFSASVTLGSSLGKENMKLDKEQSALEPVYMENTGDEDSKDAILEGKNVSKTATSNLDVHEEPLNSDISISDVSGKRNNGTLPDTATCDLTLTSDYSESYPCKKQKNASDSTLVTAIDGNDINIVERPAGNTSIESLLPSSASYKDQILDESNELVKSGESVQLPNLIGVQVEGMQHLAKWQLLEKELYFKGIEMFGKDSCLIARNLLSGLKTCTEVYSYMHDGGASMHHRFVMVPSFCMQEDSKAETEYTDQDVPTRSRLLRRRGKTRKLKYSWKSTGHPSLWKRIADGKNQSCKQYIPCGCESVCGKQCPCLHNGTCCEKYCGCSKSCKNRFRGCHCAKSQCRSRQCPCFAAGRECDPDVCRNCWVSCGDGSLGEPPRRGDGQCGNMRLLLRQQQRILLAKSDVAGWGAFLKNPVNKNDYLGEYTGELISHREADKRGKIYDRANSSFLFDLNDQYVLDAFRKGDKLKFANHSSNPNCYAKVMLVAGDHRVGIFAKEHIEASEELFYDYRYGPDQAPIWARKPEGSKRDDSSFSLGRARKHQSH